MDAIQNGPTTTTDNDRYVIGRDGVFATLYDRQEQHMVVENADEAHCRRVRDRLTSGQLAEQRHALVDLDADSACRDLPAWCREDAA